MPRPLIALLALASLANVWRPCTGTGDESAPSEASSLKIELTSEPAPADGPAITVVGTILSADGNPVPGATAVLRVKLVGTRDTLIGFTHNHEVLARTKTGANGRFIFRRIAVPLRMLDAIESLAIREGGAQVVAWSDDFGIAWTDVGGLDANPDIRLQLMPNADVHGTITDSAGKPISGAAIRIGGITKSDTYYDPRFREHADLNLDRSELNFGTQTDASGRFSLDHLPFGYRIVASIEHPSFKRQTFVINTGQPTAAAEIPSIAPPTTKWSPLVRSPIKLQMEPARSVEVKVVDHDGNPVPGGVVVATDSMNRPDGLPVPLSAQGIASLEVHSAGPYRFHCYFDPFTPQVDVVSAATDLSADRPLAIAEVKLPEIRWLSGKVIDADSGRPVPGAYAGYTQPIADGSNSRAIAGVDGTFRLPVVAGPALLGSAQRLYGYYNPTDPGDSTAPADVTPYIQLDIPASGNIEPVVVKMTHGLVISGIVHDAQGQLIVGAEVHANTQSHSFLTRTDNHGRYEFSGISPQAAVEVTAASGSDSAREAVAIDKHAPWDKTRFVNLDLDLQPGITFHGRVLRDGKPQEGVRVVLYRSADQNARPNRFSTAITDSDGRYSIGGLMVGDWYRIDVCPDDNSFDPRWPYQRNGQPVIAGSGTQLNEVNLDPASQLLSGTIVYAEGRPVAGAMVQSMIFTGSGLLAWNAQPIIFPSEMDGRGWTRTDSQGRFALPGLPNGRILLSVSRYDAKGNPIRPETPAFPELNQRDIKIICDPTAKPGPDGPAGRKNDD